MANEKQARSTKPRNNLSAEYVRELLSYEPVVGELRWKVNRRPRGKVGQIAGCRRSDGYICVGIDGAIYLAHRLAYLIMKGEWPPDQVDHQNLTPSDLTWENLRPASHSQNKWNQGLRADNKSGYKGVHQSSRNRWAATIAVDGKTKFIGLFRSPKAAHEAYKAAASVLHGDFARFE